ncbi:hypothetical protein HYX02_05255 [Candidatus Woesearchaeota archaeon]|nr:hypothetical protein [Candidatus Woesearchaeota archaeon]
MHISKKYGQSKVDECPFCRKQATTMNRQAVPVCSKHKEELLDGMKCVCGSELEVLNGKFGVFFSCMKCGNMNMRKVLELNAVKPKMQNLSQKTRSGGEITVRSDDPRYFD